jgi:uncharacterized protein YabE (DUF348 family)
MTTRNNNTDTSHKSVQAAKSTVEDPALRERNEELQRAGKNGCKPHAEAQMRRRAEELRALLRDLD